MDLRPFITSLETASVSIIITFFIGLLAAWWAVGLKNKVVKTSLDALFTLPMVLPPTVCGFFLLYMFGVQRPVGKFLIEYFGIKVVFSWSATVIAAIVMSFPLMYRTCKGAFEQVDADLIAAARTLGMSEWAILWKIYLPNALSGVVSGAILAFTRGLGEFGATSMLAGNIAGKTRTLPMAVYSEAAAGNMDSAYNYVVVVVAIALAAIIIMNYVNYRQERKFSR